MASFSEPQQLTNELAGAYSPPLSLDFEPGCDPTEPKLANTCANAYFQTYRETLRNILLCAQRLSATDTQPQFLLPAFRAFLGLRLQELDDLVHQLYLQRSRS